MTQEFFTHDDRVKALEIIFPLQRAFSEHDVRSVIELKADEVLSPLFDHNPSLANALLNEMLHMEGTISVDPDGRYSLTPYARTVANNEQLNIDNPEWVDAVDQWSLTYYREVLGRLEPDGKQTGPDQSPLAKHAHNRLDIHQRSWLQRHS